MNKIKYIVGSLGLALPFLSFAQVATDTAMTLPTGWLAFTFAVAQQQVTNFWYLPVVASGLILGFFVMRSIPTLLTAGIRAIRRA